jgi:hypothetical protein
LAVPIAFGVLALVVWREDARARRVYEATLSEAEKRQFRALRRIHPLRWRAVIALKQAEARHGPASVLNPTESRFAHGLNESFATQSPESGHDRRRRAAELLVEWTVVSQFEFSGRRRK